jgi:UDP-glucose 6-dehydrogenase
MITTRGSKMKIAIIGLGAVALADALALARHHEVVMTGPVPDRVEAINRADYALQDPSLAPYLAAHKLNLRATLDTRAALDGAGMIFISAPLSTDPATGALQLAELDSRIEFAARQQGFAPIVLRSAVPVGYGAAILQRLHGVQLVYAPEFSRAGHMLGDILHPAALVVGDHTSLGARVLAVLRGAALQGDTPARQMGQSDLELARQLAVFSKATPARFFNGFRAAKLDLATTLGATWLCPAMAPDAAVAIYQPDAWAPLPEPLRRIVAQLDKAGIPHRLEPETAAPRWPARPRAQTAPHPLGAWHFAQAAGLG